LGTSVALPSLAQARNQARMVKAMAGLKAIGSGLHMYAADNEDKFPERLTELKEYFEVETLYPDPSVPLKPYVYITGLTPKDGPQAENVIMYALPAPGGRDGLVLYVDGHVERKPGTEIAEEVRATYERLGREKDIPEDVRDLLDEE